MARFRDDSLGEGVYYAEQDHAGFVRRLVVIAVDSSMLLLVAFALLTYLPIMMSDDSDPNPAFWILWPLSAWFYLAVVKQSPLRTVGYRVTGLKIVNLKGNFVHRFLG